MKDNPRDYDPHESCREQMRDLNEEWSMRFARSCTVRAVIKKDETSYIHLPIVDVEQGWDGLVVYVK